MTTESWKRMRQTWGRMRQTWKRMRQTWERKKRKNVSAHSRQEAWGTSVIDRISEQLHRELPGLRGFSSQNIRNMRSFYEYWRQYIICSPWRANYKSVAELRFPIFEFQI